MSIYSVSFFCGVLPTTAGLLYTPPANTTTVIRQITLYNGSGSGVSTYIAVNVSGSNVVAFFDGTLASGTYTSWEGRVVLPASSTIYGFGSSAGVQANVCGYSLT